MKNLILIYLFHRLSGSFFQKNIFYRSISEEINNNTNLFSKILNKKNFKKRNLEKTEKSHSLKIGNYIKKFTLSDRYAEFLQV